MAKFLKSASSMLLLVSFVVAMLAIVISAQSSSGSHVKSDLPAPPKRPPTFATKQDLKDYLLKLHEYYAIIGRPRFGRRAIAEKRSGSYLMDESLVDPIQVYTIVDADD